MTSVRAIVVDPQAAGRFGVTDVDAPRPGPGEALVQVEASSLNRGDLLAAQQADAGWRPGHDVAGIVITAAADGTGPKAGSRVAGLLDAGAWSEQVAVATDRLAHIPDVVSFAEASTLPTAGLTAHRALEKGGLLLGKRVLITGSTGGVGLFAHQLARSSGALGADEVVVGEDVSAARSHGPYHLIVESLGGAALARAMAWLVPGGTCVTLGWSASPKVDFDLREFLAIGGGSLYGLRMYNELQNRPASDDLGLLAQMVARQQLRIPIEAEGTWDDIGDIAQRLLDRQFTGKAVLHLGR
jgi:NADPH:quinone reductase